MARKEARRGQLEAHAAGPRLQRPHGRHAEGPLEDPEEGHRGLTNLQPTVQRHEPPCQCAFEAAKSLLCSAPVLAAPDFSRPFQLEVDASAVSVSAGAIPQFEVGV